MNPIDIFLPIDRRLALLSQETLPEWASGTMLFADISGFTALTENMARELGPQRGAEELSGLLNQIYNALIAQIHRQRGSVISFSGDGMMCWFAGENADRAVQAAIGIQECMTEFSQVPVTENDLVGLSVKVALSSGEVRRFVAGNPAHNRMDILSGLPVERVGWGEEVASQGEVLLSEEIIERRKLSLEIKGWRVAKNGARFGVLAKAPPPIKAQPWPQPAPLPDSIAREWIPAVLAERLVLGKGQFFAELRPAVAVFVRFQGIDFESDPAAGDKLDRYLRWIQTIAAKFGGLLIQFTVGDKGSYYYLSFGAPITLGDDTLRAVAAADTFRHPPSELGFQPVHQIGIAQGTMRTGLYGGQARGAYGVLGDRVNLAARLMSAAPAGEIYCDESTARAAGGGWHFAPLPPMRLKGKSSPISVYCPIGRKEEINPEFVGGPQLIGRGTELGSLRAALQGTLTGAPQLVILEGEAGIGKSHLLSALAAEAVALELHPLTGAGQSIERGTAYRAWRDILYAYFDLRTAPDFDGRRERVEKFIADTLPAHQTRLPVLNDILHLGIPENEFTSNLTIELRQQNVIVLILDLDGGTGRKRAADPFPRRHSLAR